MKQNTLTPYEGSTKGRKRRGRGNSGGNYSGRGMKGQGSRSGGGVRPGFEGGQTPLVRRMPKMKGFQNPNKVTYTTVNLTQLKVFKEGESVNLDTLKAKNVIKRILPVKLLAAGELTVALKVTVNRASAAAIEKIKKAGGEVTLLETSSEKAEA
jgi:large subunit ribosomal protein L15